MIPFEITKHNSRKHQRDCAVNQCGIRHHAWTPIVRLAAPPRNGAKPEAAAPIQFRMPTVVARSTGGTTSKAEAAWFPIMKPENRPNPIAATLVTSSVALTPDQVHARRGGNERNDNNPESSRLPSAVKTIVSAPPATNPITVPIWGYTLASNPARARPSENLS